jgi:hypothetical protein
MFIILIFTKMQIQWPKKWISYIQMTREYWNGMAVSSCEHPTTLSQPPCEMFTTMNMYVSWQWVRETLFILKSECPLLPTLHSPSTKHSSFLYGKVFCYEDVSWAKHFIPPNLYISSILLEINSTVCDQRRKQCFNALDKWTIASCNYLMCSHQLCMLMLI